MKVHDTTLDFLAGIVTGDREISPYNRGRDLQELFFLHGVGDLEDLKAHSRFSYTKAILEKINGTEKLVNIIEDILDPRRFLDTTCDPIEAIVPLNKFLVFDGYEIVEENNFFKVRSLNNQLLKIKAPFETPQELNQEFIIKQIQEAEKRIEDKNYWGAITTARSLLEAVFEYIEVQVYGESKAEKEDNLIKQYNRIKEILNLDPSKKDLSDSLKQILSGLNSVICGISFFRNKMSDAHKPKYKAEKHHAILVVNASFTMANFLFDTYLYQKEKGIIK